MGAAALKGEPRGPDHHDMNVRGPNAGVEVAMRACLVAHPDALVGAIDSGGLFVPMPDSIPLNGQRIPTARSALDLVEPADRHTIISAWTKVKEEGRAHASVALLGSKSLNASVQIFDVRP